jgi:hypothetical protein
MDACRDRFLKGRHEHAIAKIAAEVLTSGALFEPQQRALAQGKLPSWPKSVNSLTLGA